MLQYIPAGIGVDPGDVPSLGISGTCSIVLDNLTLYCATPTQSVAIDLHGRLASQVAAALPSGVAGAVQQDGPAELLLWPDGLGDPPSGNAPATFTLAQAPLWQLLAAFARALEGRRRDLHSAVAQINVRAAVGMWLDWWAASLGVERHTGEPDALFAARIVGTTLAPNINGVAIEQLFAALGYGASISDQSPGQFSASFTFPAHPPAGYIYSQAQLAAILNDAKAAGVVALVNFLASLADSMSLSDTVTASAPVGYAVSDKSLSDESTSA